MLLRFVGFAGANLALHPLLLPEGVGVESLNQKPGRGDLRPWNEPLDVATVASGTKTIYRMGRDVANDADYWLEWSTRVNVARGFIASDTTERTFWTGDGSPKWTDNSIGLGSAPYPDAAGVRILGVPKPNADPTLSEQAAGTGTDEDRAYVVTWVNDRGEESQPSNADTITCKPGATIRITRHATIPSGNYGLDKWRVYRTVAGGENDYYFVAEVDDATSYVDESGSINTASPLLSESWAVPPASLWNLKALWNGMFAGVVGKSVRFCEPFRPFAWPSEYELLVDDDIIGLARWRQNLVVLTVGQPYIITGSSPDAMSLQPVELNQACTSRYGIVEFGHGVAWPSPDGLTYMGDAGARLLTAGLIQREEWQALGPTTWVAGEYEGLYLGSYNSGGRKSLLIDPLDPRTLYFSDVGFNVCHRDPIADALYILLNTGTDVKRWEGGSTPLTAKWKSGIQRLPKPSNLAWCQVVADAYPVTLSIWADGTLRVNAKSVTSRAAFRLPSGFLAEQWQVLIETDGAVQTVLLAQSIEELNAA